MSSFRPSLTLSLGSLVLLGAIGLAENVDPKAGKLAQPAGKPEPASVPAQPRSDPTMPSDKLREAIESGKAEAAPRLPTVILRGRVLAKDKPPAALLEVDLKQPPQLVGKGTRLLSGKLKLTVTEVNDTEVRIEVSPLNETIVLR